MKDSVIPSEVRLSTQGLLTFSMKLACPKGVAVLALYPFAIEVKRT